MSSKKKGNSLAHKPKRSRLEYRREWVGGGRVKLVIGKRFPLEELAEAMRYVQSSQHAGKAVITIG